MSSKESSRKRLGTFRRYLSGPVDRIVGALGYQLVPRGRTLAPGFDDRDVATFQKVKPFTMTSPERVAALCQAIRYVVRSEIPGAIVECGVWRGGSMMAVARTLMESQATDRELFLFDTFEGMPAPGERDRLFTGETVAELLEHPGVADRIQAYASFEDVRKNMSSVAYPAERLHFVRGKVEDTIPDRAPQAIAVLRLDTDWYESTRHELLHLFPRLSTGGVLIIDDYGDWQGARQAVDEYVEKYQGPLLLNRIDHTGRIAVKL